MIERLNYPHIGLLILAWFVADLATPILMAVARRIGAVDRPHTYKSHKDPVPFLGGMGIFAGCAVALISILRFTGFVENLPIFGLLLGAGFVVVLGVIDDFRPMSAVVKLIILLVATLVLSGFGLRINIFPHAESWGNYANAALTLLWLAGVTSAVNSLDNMDGAAGGVTAVAAMFMFYIAWRNFEVSEAGAWQIQQRQLSFVAIALLGGCLGFLRYNFAPARVFLGDNGSLLLGFLLAGMAILGCWSMADSLRSFLIPCALLVVPLYDITLSTILRLQAGVVGSLREAIVYCGRDHISHRLVALGLNRREAVLLMYLWGAQGGAAAYYMSRPGVDRPSYLLVAGSGIVVLSLVGLLLGRAKVYTAEELSLRTRPAAADA